MAMLLVLCSQYIYRMNIYTLPDIVEINIFRFDSGVILAFKKKKLFEVYVNIFWLTKVLHFKCYLHNKERFCPGQKKMLLFFMF